MEVWPSLLPNKKMGRDAAQLEREERGSTAGSRSTGASVREGGGSQVFSPSLSVQVPTPPPLSVLPPPPLSLLLRLPSQGSSFDKHCTQMDAPGGAEGDYDALAHDKSHRLRRQRGYVRKGSRAALKTRPRATDVTDRKPARGTADEPPEARQKRSRVGALRVASVLNKEAVKTQAQWRDPCKKGKWNATVGSPLEGADAAISGWTADQRNKSLRQEVSPGQEHGHAAQDRSATDRELRAWSKFNVFMPLRAGGSFESVGGHRVGSRGECSGWKGGSEGAFGGKR